MVEQILVKTQSKAKLLNQMLAILDELDKSILTKAFQGKLVPQNPNDEPASILIERIHKKKANAHQRDSF